MMMRNNCLDSRDLEERIRELESLKEDEGLDESDKDELDELVGLRDDVGSEWSCGVLFIAESYFEEYARCLAEDIGNIQDSNTWPCRHIDWSAAADELAGDYCRVTIHGDEYLYHL